MRALIDVHHSDLAESLHRLLEDRLGLEVHVPYGMGWWDEGYWAFGYQHAGDALARQFLMADAVDDLQPHRTRRLTTLEEARDLDDWALVIASVPDNEPGYYRFAHEKHARYAVEVGNVNQRVDRSYDPLILDSTGQYPGGVAFTPEFDMDGSFAYAGTPGGLGNVASFVNLFPGLPCYWQFEQAKKHLPEWAFEVFGHNGPDGFTKPTSLIGSRMGFYDFGWHDKISGDGFGYVIHYWASVGRPLIGHGSHYRGQVAADLWEDGVTCIDLDMHTPSETAEIMQAVVNDPDRHAEMCFEISRRVRERIDFAADAERVRKALGLPPFSSEWESTEGAKRKRMVPV